MTSNVPKNGIHALAYSPSDVTSPLSCFLSITHFGKEQTAITLRFSICIHGFDDKQIFTFLYNADDLVPGKNSLKRATTLPPQDTPLPPQDQLDMITRSRSPNLRILSMTITKPCDILCPRSSGSLASKDRTDPAYSQFVKLASATEIYILFDEKWLPKEQCSGFIVQLKELIAHPFDNYRIANWSDFIPIKDAVSEDPPPYTNASNKRPFEDGDSDIKLVSKRQLLSFAPSPTKKATTASTPSPEPPSSPIVKAPDYQRAIENAVKRLLPEALQTILPDMLLRLPAAPTLSPSPSMLSPSPSTSSPSLSSLGTLISARIANHIEDQLREIYAKTLEDADYLRDVADIEFKEDLEHMRHEFSSIKDDTIDDITRLSDDILNQFKDSAAEIVEEVEEEVNEHARNVYDRIRKRLDVLVESGAYFKKKRQGTGQNTAGDQGRRAISLPCVTDIYYSTHTIQSSE